MIGREQDDPLVGPARGAAEAARDQVRRHEVVGNGDPGYAMTRRRRKRFLRERPFKGGGVVIHRREQRPRPECHRGAQLDGE